MATSSFNTQNITEHSSAHIFRESKVTYLLDHDTDENEYYLSPTLNIDEFKKQAQESYTLHHTQSQQMQKKQFDGLIKEAVINMNKETTIEHVKKLFEHLHTKFGGYQVFQIGVHNDEGVFIEYAGKNNEEWDLDDYTYDSIKMTWLDKQGNETTDIIAHRPERDIFYNKDNETWYNDKKYEQKADMSVLKKFHNYHAHVIYSPFDLKTGKGRMQRKDMREIQTYTALKLNMTRGKEASHTKRGTHWQRKRIADAVNDAKKIHLQKESVLKKKLDETTENLNKVIENKESLKKYRDNWKKATKELRKKLQLEKAQRVHYSQLEAKQKEILEKIKSGQYTYEEATHELQNIANEIINNLNTKKEESKDSSRIWLDNEIGQMVEEMETHIIKLEEITGMVAKHHQPEKIIPHYGQELNNIVVQLDKQISTDEKNDDYWDLYDDMHMYQDAIIRLEIQKEANIEIKIEHLKLKIGRCDNLLNNTDKYRMLQTHDEVKEIEQEKKVYKKELDELSQKITSLKKRKKEKTSP